MLLSGVVSSCSRHEDESVAEAPSASSPAVSAEQPTGTADAQMTDHPEPMPVEPAPVTSPHTGSPLRQQILDAVRPAVEADLGQPVRFNVSSIRTDGIWAYLSATPLTPEYQPVDYSATKYAADIEEGAFDDWLCALVEREGDIWIVRALEIGATDAPFVDWPERFGAPGEVVMPVAAD